MNQASSSLCRCDGWWEEQGYGRQPMENLRIACEQGCLQGAGTDIVGPFTLTGTIAADGGVFIHKQYIGRHDVEYTGTFDGEGTMWGQWRIECWQGPWMIKIRACDSDAGEEIVLAASDRARGPLGLSGV